MINQIEYENAKNIISQYEKEQKEYHGEPSVICILKGIKLRRGMDGNWLSFSTSSGNSSVINIANYFPLETITHKTIREWAIEQEPILSVCETSKTPREVY